MNEFCAYSSAFLPGNFDLAIGALSMRPRFVWVARCAQVTGPKIYRKIGH